MFVYVYTRRACANKRLDGVIGIMLLSSGHIWNMD